MVEISKFNFDKISSFQKFSNEIYIKILNYSLKSLPKKNLSSNTRLKTNFILGMEWVQNNKSKSIILTSFPLRE